MDFVDTNLAALADPASRGAFFASAELERIGGVAFDVDSMGLADPFTAIFDELTFGYTAPGAALLEGQFGLPSAPEKASLQFTARGLPGQEPLFVDAIWKGAIVARATTSLSPIEEAKFTWTDEEIDREIITDLGALPAEPQLETERRTRLLARMKAAAHQADAIDDERLDAMLDRIGVGTVGELLTSWRAVQKSGVGTVTYAAPPAVSVTPQLLPFAGAILLRNAGFSLSQLLAQSNQVKQQLVKDGLEAPAESWVKKRRTFTLIWVVPIATFDDNGWPGANRNQRITRAAGWLAEQGIALIPK